MLSAVLAMAAVACAGSENQKPDGAADANDYVLDGGDVTADGPDVDLGDLVTTWIHPAGMRAFTYERSQAASTAQLQGLFEAGFDVVSANTGANDVQARINVNQAHGVDPP